MSANFWVLLIFIRLFSYQSVNYFWKRSFYANICAIGFSFDRNK